MTHLHKFLLVSVDFDTRGSPGRLKGSTGTPRAERTDFPSTFALLLARFWSPFGLPLASFVGHGSSPGRVFSACGGARGPKPTLCSQRGRKGSPQEAPDVGST